MKKIVLFDVDNVLVKGQTQKLLLKFLFKKRKVGFPFFLKIYFWFLLYKCNLIKDTNKVRKEAYKSLSNWSEVETKELFKEFFEQEIKPRLFNQGINLIQVYINQGYEVVLTSASLSEIVEQLKEYLSLKFAISTKLEVSDNRYTGRIFEPVPYGENKVTEVKKLLESNNLVLEGSYAYADHYSDLPILELVEKPNVVNPDRKLWKIAKNRGWNVHRFK